MIVILHIPKTGGTSFRDILENSFGWSHFHTNHTRKSVFRQADLVFARKWFPRLRCVSGHNLVDPLSLTVPDPFYATFLREPVSRVISHYQYSVLRGGNQLTFEQSVRRSENLKNLQVKLIAGESNLDKAKRFLDRCDFVGLTEKFDLSLHLLQRLSPFKLNLNYQRRIVAKNNAVKMALENNPRMIELARDENRLDLELYAFAVEEVFPRLCAAAGLSVTENLPSFERPDRSFSLKCELGRLHNRLFRQIYKIRSLFIRPRADDVPLGNTAQDLFGPVVGKSSPVADPKPHPAKPGE